MKKLIITVLFAFFTSLLFAQKDTLTIPLGKYGFIKIGDKVYKITASLEEVANPPQSIFLQKVANPPQSIFLQNYNGTGTILLNPTLEPAGTYALPDNSLNNKISLIKNSK